MPSPFPGMDPYLEHPAHFPDIHDCLIVGFREQLNQRLPKNYSAKIRHRVWVEYSERFREPDVDVLQTARPSSRELDSNGGTAVIAVNVRPIVVYVPEERRESYLEIRAVQTDNRLVTAIEILSLSNKTPGDQGREQYLQKQREYLSSRANLIEIDLHRAGEHSTAVPRNRAVAEAGAFDYHVCVHRFFAQGQFLVYPIHLERRLPPIEVPLLPADEPVALDLQAAFDHCYDSGDFFRESPYLASALEPPLTPTQTEWAERLLREKNLLPPA